jgi:hypothetical protein
MTCFLEAELAAVVYVALVINKTMNTRISAWLKTGYEGVTNWGHTRS